MKMALLKAAGAGLLLGLMAGLPAQAQISSDGGPIYINSERTETMQRERKVVLVGNVDIRQGTARLRADTVTILFSGEQGEGASTTGVAAGFGQIQRIQAEGDVYYVTPELKAKGDRGVYELATDTITMTGNVALMRDKDVAEGQVLRMEVANQRTTLEGGGGRIRAVIDPSSASGPDR